MLKSVQAAHFASLLSWLAIDEQDRVGAVIYNGINTIECKPTARQRGPLHIINALISAQQNALQAIDNVNSEGFSTALKRLHYLCPKGSEIIVISDFYHLRTTDKRRLSQLRQHNRIQFVQISDPLEQGQTQFRGYEHVTDSHQTAWLDFSAKKTRDSLSQQYQTHQNFISEMATSLAIPLHTLSAAQSLLQQLGAHSQGIR